MARIDLKDSYHMLFWEETREHIAVMEQELLNIEAGLSNDETIRLIFRMAHSLKGAAATLGLDDMSELAHELESLLTRIKQSEIKLDRQVMDVLLEALDVMKLIHKSLIEVERQEDDVTKFLVVVAKLQAYMGNENNQTLCLRVFFEDETDLVALKAYIVVEAIKKHGVIQSIEPEDYETLEDDAFQLGLQVCVTTEDSFERLMETLNQITDLKSVERIEREAASESEPEALLVEGIPTTTIGAMGAIGEERALLPDTATAPVMQSETGAVKVNIQKIDKLINLVGELIIDKESINTIAQALKAEHRKNPNVIRLLDVFEHLDYIGSELQEIVLSTRLLPLETIFSKFPRLVRDVSKQCGKNVQLVIEGKEHGIDRGMIEALVDPLTHLIRNAIDHGIEDEWTRLSKGKPAVGTLKLSANQGDNHVLVTIEDDGKGIDIGKIQKKVIEKGWISFEEADFLGYDEWLSYVFMPGFSTQQEVSVISGRGVGLDVVKSNISRLNGQIEIWTEVDRGTKFTLKLPLTMAIIKAMLVQESHCTFAIPVSSIVEVFRLKDAEITERIHSTGYSQMVHWREQAIPLMSLASLFDLEGVAHCSDKMYVVVLGIGEKRTAVVVSSILGEQEVVIKSMGEFVGKDKLFGELTGISGVSILGDGSLAHILDVSDLIKH